MTKLIISETQFNSLKKYLMEEIDPSEAYSHSTSLQTVIDGKRGVGFYGGANRFDIQNMKKSGLKYIRIGMNQAYVFYRDGYEEQANQLAMIARKNRGYLPIKRPEETYVIGVLLGYDKGKVKKFVLDYFPNFNFQ